MSERGREIIALLQKEGRAMWAGEVADALGLPFHQMECARGALERLLRKNIVRRYGGPPPARVFYELVRA